MNRNNIAKTPNSENIKFTMFEYVNNKYNKNFNEIGFELAVRGLDSNNYDTLILQDDNGVIFNVFSSADKSRDDVIFDDYATAVIDKIFNDYFFQSDNESNINISSVTNLISDDQITMDDVYEKSVEELMNEFELSSITLLILVENDNISKYINEIYNCYKKVSDLNPEYLDFEIISTSTSNEQLINMMQNMRLNYENDWSKYSSITEKCIIDSVGYTKDVISAMIEEV